MITKRRRQIKISNTVVGWLKGQHSNKQILLWLSPLVGLCSGLAAFILKWLIDFIKHVLTYNLKSSGISWLYLVYPAIGILLAMLFVKYIVRDDISHGVTKILYAISKKRGRIRRHNRWSSIIASAFTIGFGGSVGAEAPILLTGSAFASDLGKRFHLKNSQILLLVCCGAAGAVSAIFKAPIAGVMFVLEVLMLDLSMSSLLPVLITSIVAICVSYITSDMEPMFPFSLDESFRIHSIPGCLIFGIVCGLLSLYFTRCMNKFEGVFHNINQWWMKYLLGASVLGVLIFLFPAMYGEGYDVIEQLINNASPSEIMHNTLFSVTSINLIIYLLLVLFLKVFATTATNGAGGCGGVFAPTLFLGCIAGFLFAQITEAGVPVKNCALYGMAGMMSGVMHAPLTAMFLIAELTGGYNLFVPLMIVSVVSYLTIRIFEPHSIYAMRLARRGQLLTHDKDQAVLTLMNLDSQIETDYIPLNVDMNLGQIVAAVIKSHRNIFPVVDNAGLFKGVITLDGIRKYMFRPELYKQYNVRSFVHNPPAMLLTSDTVKVALKKFEATHAWNLPVVDETARYVGFVSRSGLFASYRNMLVSLSDE